MRPSFITVPPPDRLMPKPMSFSAVPEIVPDAPFVIVPPPDRLMP
jgi:hypothetical protein